MSTVTTYSATDVIASFGTHVITGAADDNFISIEANGDGFGTKVGLQGDVVRSKDPNHTFTVKISLLQTSPTNAYFQERYNRDQDTSDAMDPLVIKNLRGGEVFQSEAAWVAKPATLGYGKDAGNREWEIHTGPATLKG